MNLTTIMMLLIQSERTRLNCMPWIFQFTAPYFLQNPEFKPQT